MSFDPLIESRTDGSGPTSTLTASRQKRQLEGERQDELPNRHRGQDAVDKVRRLRGHAPSRTGRAEPAIFTRERD